LRRSAPAARPASGLDPRRQFIEPLDEAEHVPTIRLAHEVTQRLAIRGPFRDVAHDRQTKAIIYEFPHDRSGQTRAETEEIIAQAPDRDPHHRGILAPGCAQEIINIAFLREQWPIRRTDEHAQCPPFGSDTDCDVECQPA